MNKYMTMDRFYDLAKRNCACEAGLRYLKTWMKKHPNKKTVDYFFKDHTRIKKSHITIYNAYSNDNNIKDNEHAAFQIRSYFKWMIFQLIDWSEQNTDYFECIKWMEKYYNYNYYCLKPQNNTDKNNRNAIRLLLTSFEGEE